MESGAPEILINIVFLLFGAMIVLGVFMKMANRLGWTYSLQRSEQSSYPDTAPGTQEQLNRAAALRIAAAGFVFSLLSSAFASHFRSEAITLIFVILSFIVIITIASLVVLRTRGLIPRLYCFFLCILAAAATVMTYTVGGNLMFVGVFISFALDTCSAVILCIYFRR